MDPNDKIREFKKLNKQYLKQKKVIAVQGQKCTLLVIEYYYLKGACAGDSRKEFNAQLNAVMNAEKYVAESGKFLKFMDKRINAAELSMKKELKAAA